MPSSVTDYGLDYYSGVLFGSSFAQPANYHLALLGDIPDPAANGTMLIEPDPLNGYGRVTIPNDGTVFGTPAGGVVANIVSIDFGIVTTADWPVIKAYALCDDPGVGLGNVYLYGTLRIPRAPSVGHQVSFDVGLLTFSVNPIHPTIVPSA